MAITWLMCRIRAKNVLQVDRQTSNNLLCKDTVIVIMEKLTQLVNIHVI